jgi:GTPase
MKWRLREGNGEALYNIGVEDNGVMTGLSDEEMSSSLDTLQDMARRLGATVQVLHYVFFKICHVICSKRQPRVRICMVSAMPSPMYF